MLDVNDILGTDLLLEAFDERDGLHVVAIEVSYTVDARDTTHALRNAARLRQYTGFPAHAVVAGGHKDQEIESLLQDGSVH